MSDGLGAKLPGLYMTFKSASVAAIEGTSRGRIGLTWIDSTATEDKFFTYDISNKSSAKTDLPDDYSVVDMAFRGVPRQLLVYVIGGVAADRTQYEDVINEFYNRRCNAVSVLRETDENEIQNFISTVKALNQKKFRFFAVLCNKKADDINLVNFATKEGIVGDKVYSGMDMLPYVTVRVGTIPFNKSITYETVSWLDDVESLTQSQQEDSIDRGELRLIFDGENVKFLTGINSLSTIPSDADETWKKLRVITTMHQIQNDINLTAEKAYIGKVDNNENGQRMLIGAIKNYMSRLRQLNGIKDEFDIYVDPENTPRGDRLWLGGYYHSLDSVERLYVDWSVHPE